MENTTLPKSRKLPYTKPDDPLNAKINRHFLIRWKLKTGGKDRLVSAGKYEKVLAENSKLPPLETKIEHFERALTWPGHKLQIVTRDNLIFTFISK